VFDTVVAQEDYVAFSDEYEEYLQLMQNGALQSSVSGFEPASQGGIKPVEEITPQVFYESSKTGSYRFPIISTFKNWRVETYQLSGIPIGKIEERKATLRIAKDDGVTDIILMDKEGKVLDLMGMFEIGYAVKDIFP
jgi:hypothetical protein